MHTIPAANRLLFMSTVPFMLNGCAIIYQNSIFRTTRPLEGIGGTIRMGNFRLKFNRLVLNNLVNFRQPPVPESVTGASIIELLNVVTFPQITTAKRHLGGSRHIDIKTLPQISVCDILRGQKPKEEASA